MIHQHGLTKVGEVYHQFGDDGYTAVVCLTESQISIHTWPEFNRVTFDVFLSNFMNYNPQLLHYFIDGFIWKMKSDQFNWFKFLK